MEMRRRVLGLNGIFGVHKPAGESSARTVERIKSYILSLLSPSGSRLPFKEYQSLKRSLKVGHGGTLDPLATGVLVIGLGTGCKRLHSFLHGTTKTYRAQGRFGEEYDTYDRTGLVKAVMPFDHIEQAALRDVLREKFTGEIKQVPPLFSALHINGERAYDIARKRQKEQLQRQEAEKQARLSEDAKPEDDSAPRAGTGEDREAVELEARLVRIDRLELLRLELPDFEIELDCGSGTYVRSLIHDIGRAMNSAAAMFELVRTAQGPVKLDDCLSMEELLPGDAAALDKMESAMKRYPE